MYVEHTTLHEEAPMRTTAEPRSADRTDWFIVPRSRGADEPSHLHFDRLARVWRRHTDVIGGAASSDEDGIDLRARKSA
jgi:hypothetical protein